MITQDELNAVRLSATKKDFYQIWNELLDLASKISERWDPQNTNESDPGIVLLKVLTAVADKLNYNVDINALEVFMPSAAQMESMRKITEMLGYNIKYYQSATTNVKITYTLNTSSPIQGVWKIDKFTNIKDVDDTINYVTLAERYINENEYSVEIPCIEGELIECETDNDNIVSLLQLDDNNRYYLPETQIAENGILIFNVNDGQESEPWESVYNLNTQPLGKPCYKFGYDSKENLPYIQFPDDISNIIEDGLRIKYIRTNGVNGNISARTLYKMEKPVSWQILNEDEEANTDKPYLNPDNYIVTNPSAAKNGANVETLTDAYNNFKKTIGTFDTLVTCRDYMNKIYQLTMSQTDTTPLVSNIIVSDIRDDINKAFTLCTFGSHGIEYKNTARNEFASAETQTIVGLQGIVNDINGETDPTALETKLRTYLGKVYKVVEGTKSTYYVGAAANNNNTITFEFRALDTNKPLECFDLVFYPFTTIYNLSTKVEYQKSFKYDDTNLLDIKQDIEENKTLAHNIISPSLTDIACIKNYYRLSTKIVTNKKVNAIEQLDILANIYTKLYENFNMRKVDFGEQLVEETIEEVIQNADARIKSCPLDPVEISTYICTVGGEEYPISNQKVTSIMESVSGEIYFNKLVLNNVLAGRIQLFNYNSNFTSDYNEASLSTWGSGSHYDLLYPSEINEAKTNGVYQIYSNFFIRDGSRNVKLTANEIVQFRMPSLKTEQTYPAYVNYYFKGTPKTGAKVGIPATMRSLLNYLNSDISAADPAARYAIWESAAAHVPATEDADVTAANFNNEKAKYKALFIKDANDVYKYANAYVADETYYYLPINNTTFASWAAWVTNIEYDEAHNKLSGIFYAKPSDYSLSYGKYIDRQHIKYIEITAYRVEQDPFSNYYIQLTHDDDYHPSTANPETWYTKDGLGQDADVTTLNANEEHLLAPNEFLLINYTHATSTEGSNKTVINRYIGPGNIIKPSFALADSQEYRTTHSYTKTSGFGDFRDDNGYIVTDPEVVNIKGMFTLGTNEQIEERKFISVVLSEPQTNIYWIRNDDAANTDSSNRIIFKFDEDPNPNDPTDYLGYTLKDGEYFFYTNRDKNDLAYYGAGTKIKKQAQTPTIYKTKTEQSVSAEDILTLGLSAAIPWRTYTFGTTNNALEFHEYKYITLTEGSILVSLNDATAIKPQAQGAAYTQDGVQVINNSWQDITDPEHTVYKFEEAEQSEKLTPINLGADIKWEVRTRLNLNISPSVPQILNINKLDTAVQSYDMIKIWDKNNDPLNGFEINPLNPNEPISIKANKLIQSGCEKTFLVDEDETISGSIPQYDVQLKVYKSTELTYNEDSSGSGLATLNLNNFGDGNYTKITFEDATTTNPYLKLHTIVPNDYFGLVMIYCINSTANPNPLVAAKKSDDTSAPLSIFNNGGNWWADTDAGRLRKGLNIIQIDHTCTELQFSIDNNASKNTAVIFGKLDIINTAKPLNTKLSYNKINQDTAYKQILADIKALDPEFNFYYNAVINNESALDLNTSDDTDTLKDNPLNWYNYNNINNKFVISEIDADYLKDHIVIAKNSKL